MLLNYASKQIRGLGYTVGLVTTFGNYVTDVRKRVGLNQKQLAERIKREGQPISPQYLNDIEHDRRTPSSDVIRGIADALSLDRDYLHYLARKWPDDLAQGTLEPDQVRELMFAFRNGPPKG